MASLKRTILVGIGGTGGLTAANRLLALVTAMMLTRLLGADSYGHYAFASALITVLAIPIHAGLPVLIAREVASAELDRAWGRLRGILRFGNSLVAVVATIGLTAAAMALGLGLGLEGMDDARRLALMWALPLLPVIGFTVVRASTLQGLRRVIYAQLPSTLIRPVVMLSLVGAVLVAEHPLDAPGAMQLQVLAGVTGLFVGQALLHHALPRTVKQSHTEVQTRLWIGSLLPLGLVTATRIADTELPLLMLGILGQSADVGHFRVASQAAMLVPIGMIIVMPVIQPHITRLHLRGEDARLQNLITRSTRSAFAPALALTIVFALWGDRLLRLLFGSEYADAHYTLLILAVGHTLSVGGGPAMALLNMTRNTKRAIAGSLLTLALHIPLSAALIPVLGQEGAALSTAASLILWKLWISRAARRATGIRTSLL